MAYESRCQHKLISREVKAAISSHEAIPTYLKWSESAITFDRADHPNSIPQLGRFPLIVNHIVSKTRLTNVLMDGRSGLNILYAETYNAMGLAQSCIRATGAPFHGVVPRVQAIPLELVDLPVTFERSRNFHTETLTFEVANFPGLYHAILGRPCYVKFMAIPNYTYHNFKIPGPKGVMTVGWSI
jgi:hypothetical protein